MDSVNASVVSHVSRSASDVASVLANAGDLARAAVCEVASPDAIGEHYGVVAEGEWAASHRFAAHLRGYRGWEWNVVVATFPGGDCATVSELALLPGADALLPPPWVPWEDRIDPDDLGPGDILPPKHEDTRLVPGYVETGDPAIDDVAHEIGLGRRQVLSLAGRVAAADRWASGSFGPSSEMARSAPGLCCECGFFAPIAGSLGAAFGVCANEYSADGRVVHAEYGCGAHSDTSLPTGAGSPMFEPYDDGVLDMLEASLDAANGDAANGDAANGDAANGAADSADAQ
ncbi:DUF3027 domain-containing protein [Hoyosella rhizosphaerae]|uniref:DUF3027 domain-containing protein n=1 Tax=Hoyosella rhizosphaerae TaxID=1755582 RepID=A0A916UHI0_9ACTN|nr:DUF3027 domain-containing protein [Hoyosella rhizosphaerae]MBN4928193.1 DUF3027 domain-containing protein [Hoyosella rhizosphaerae]GGC73109.1 hypothetical protein GCM10011410_27780 [Hoyosella rhizosphaerae]